MRRTVQSARDRLIERENQRNADLANVRATAAQYDLLRQLSDPNTGDPERLMDEVNKLLDSRDTQTQHYQRQAEINTHVRDLGDRYDAEVVRPIFSKLPAPEAQRIVDQSPAHLVGLAHRAYLVNEALGALEQHWTQVGEQRARRSLSRSEAFRKDVFHEATNGRPTPELIEASAPSRASADANTWLRNIFRS